MSLLDSNAIQIAVRCRPWHPTKEQPFLAVPTNQPYFYGDGNIGGSTQRPVAAGALRNVVEIIDNRELDFDKPQEPTEGRRGAPMVGRRYKNRKYVFDQIFSMEASQEEVFERTAKPLLPGVLDGYNATVFAYGATGCGKTHTISGTEEQPGIIVRTMRELFDLVEDSKLQYDTYFKMSMVEIYNETIRDLLSDEYPACPPGGLKLLENEKERVKVAHVTEKEPESVEDVMSLVMLGNERRSTSFTARNSTSSRSHLVLQINVVREQRKTDVELDEQTVTQRLTSATLSIIDLAGSEKASVNRGQRMKEGANINKSLLALSGCISALCQPPVRGIRQHVPYRDSKLTRLLKFSLGGNCRTVMINCISPSSKDIEETNNTLLWADKAKKVSTKVSRNTAGVELRTAQWIQKIVTLEATIKSLEQQLSTAQKGHSGMQKRRIENARLSTKGEMDKVQMELDALLPVVRDGSEMEALWNGSVLQIEALETRLHDIETEIQSGRNVDDALQEKNHIRSLIQQQDQAYRFNSEIQAGIQQKSIKHITLDNLLKKVEERVFDDDLAEAKYEHQLEVMRHQAHVARIVAAAKDRGLKDFIAQQADSATKSASLLSRFSNILRTEVSALSASANPDPAEVLKKLQHLVKTVDTSVASLFGEAPAPLSVAQARLPPAIAAPSPRRASARGAGSSPKRFGQRMSPRKSAPSRSNLFPSASASLSSSSSSAPSSGTKDNRVRWPDETGEGKIDDRSIAPDCPVFSSPSDAGNASTVNASTASSSFDSEEVKTIPPKPPAQVMPTALRPIPPAAPKPLPLLSTSTSTSSTASSGDASSAEIPAWKQNRIMRGLASHHAIDAIAEESMTQSPTGSGKSSPLGASRIPTGGLMGPPARMNRPGPLAELHSVPGIGPRPSLSHSTSSSNLLKPTASSAARSSLAGNTSSSAFANVKIQLNSGSSSAPGSMGPPTSTSTASRRVSMIGPARHDRPRQRMSMLPASHPHHAHGAGGSEPSFSGLSSKGLPTTMSGNVSALSGGAKRVEGSRPRMSMQCE
ncbi:kinesin [Kwoniella heveanensis BCC8398]|uniref:Kinesin n=1 Tax=Kwoniella heveanensis BCC8398 TaxID=1296120 RepID=A0A1B9H0Q7_9TREE|nr:kinesin [Kwoniella heveanensis BCC8398]